MQRLIWTILVAFAASLALGPVCISWIKKLKFGQTIYDLGPDSHKVKQGTPTMGGIKTTRGDYTVIENRREAIRYALRMARPGDVVVLAGKGHETYQEIKGVKHPFNEKTIVKEILETF